MFLKILLLALVILQFAAAHQLHSAAVQESNDQRVRNFVAAFNKRNLNEMLSLVTDDVQWLSVAGEKISTETKGKEKLQESMAGYCKAVPSAQSELEWVQETSSRVAARERASWDGKPGRLSQISLSVYEFRAGLICRVYYFPAEK